jgi:hypothetical protein
MKNILKTMTVEELKTLADEQADERRIKLVNEEIKRRNCNG